MTSPPAGPGGAGAPTGRGDRARRLAVAGAMTALFVLALAIFVLPFAFPTPPPVVTRFHSTSLFSPNDDGRRDVALVNVRLSEPAELTIEVQSDGRTVRELAGGARRRAGRHQFAWDGSDADGRRVPDGAYAIKLRARAGAKRFNTTRSLTVDTTPPAAPAVTVSSGALDPSADAACRVEVEAREAGSVVIVLRREGAGRPARRVGPRPIRAGEAVTYRWDGARGAGGTTPPGLHEVVVAQIDAARNRVERRRTCWVGLMSGRPVPAEAAPGEEVGARLLDADGRPLPPRTPVVLALNRRAAIPGLRTGHPLGERMGPAVRGTAAGARIRLPRGVNPAALWLVARRDDGEPGVALMRLRAP